MVQSIEGWKQTNEADLDVQIDAGTRCHIHHYGAGQGYCWQVWRDGFGLSGVVTALDEAYARCQQGVDMDRAAFNRLVADELLDEMRNIHKRLATLGYSDRIEGYSSGYQHGREVALAEVRALLAPLYTQESAA